MPAFLLNPKFIGAAVVLLIIIALGISLKVQTARLNACKDAFETFKIQVKTLGEQAERDAKLKEKGYADSIKIAVSSRADALKRLRDLSARSSPMPNNPTAPAGSDEICISSGAYNAAFQKFGADLAGFIQGTRGLAIQGDEAQIDAKALFDGWPK